MSDSPITGHCLCGAISYSADTEPALTAICHCDDCQRQSGAPFSLNLVLDGDALEIQGDTLGTFETVGTDTGETRERKFCTKCGSPILTTLAEMGTMVAVKAGTLDDRSWLAPEMELWCEGAHPWIKTGEERGEFPRGLET